MLFLGYFFHHLVCMHSSQKTHRQLHAHVNLGSVGSVCVNGGYEWAQKHQQKIDGCKIDSGSRTDSSWSGQRTLKKEEFEFNFFTSQTLESLSSWVRSSQYSQLMVSISKCNTLMQCIRLHQSCETSTWVGGVRKVSTAIGYSIAVEFFHHHLDGISCNFMIH